MRFYMLHYVVVLSVFTMVSSLSEEATGTEAKSEDNVFSLINGLKRLFTTSGSRVNGQEDTKNEFDNATTCPVGCDAGWQPPQEWSECKFGIDSTLQPECYRSIQRRKILCKKNKKHCSLVEIRPCLHEDSCLGQWSSWSTLSNNCSANCTGFKTRVHHCYKDGDLAKGMCLGGSINASNQTDLAICTTHDCVGNNQPVSLPPNLIATNTSSYYMFYSAIALFALVCLILIFISCHKILKKKKPRLEVEDYGVQSSNSFVVTGLGQPEGNFLPITSSQPVQNLNIVSLDAANLYQTINPTDIRQPNISAMSYPTAESTSPHLVRRLPSLPHSQHLRGISQFSKPNPTKRKKASIASKYGSVFDKVRAVESNSFDSGSYTTMSSFTSTTSVRSTLSYDVQSSLSSTYRKKRSGSKILKGMSEGSRVASQLWKRPLSLKGRRRGNSSVAAKIEKLKTRKYAMVRRNIKPDQHQVTHPVMFVNTVKVEQSADLAVDPGFTSQSKITNSQGETQISAEYLTPIQVNKMTTETTVPGDMCNYVNVEDQCAEKSGNGPNDFEYVTIMVQKESNK
ncbi:uncharacterized protein LOC143470319 isoform X2 [Clavelina lepadiformis]|uniref:uncharacterized protein LOC143470319 isoform X2 n=1 Tax=Clavelina lepadiformis TaxID=159417 RepID=UPI00404113A9